MPAISYTGEDELERLVNKAKLYNLWVYCKSTKIWYTPDEFYQLGKALIIEGNKDPFLYFNLVDPKQGIRDRAALAKRAAIELQDFTDRVMNYYNFIDKRTKG